MTPVGVFFIYPNEDKCYFVNSANLRQLSVSAPVGMGALHSMRLCELATAEKLNIEIP